MSSPLARLGQRHPVVGGIVAALVWGGGMFVIFSVLTRFNFEALNAVLWSVGGIAVGSIMYWKWSRSRQIDESL